MANVVKYKNQTWGEPIPGERLSTNGHYTGEHISTPIQDALGADTTNINAHYIEGEIVHLGTMMQDAIEGSTPEVAE